MTVDVAGDYACLEHPLMRAISESARFSKIKNISIYN